MGTMSLFMVMEIILEAKLNDDEEEKEEEEGFSSAYSMLGYSLKALLVLFKPHCNPGDTYCCYVIMSVL